MSARHLCLSAVSALALAACATSQENPNYQYSTKYKASSPYADANANTSATQTQAAAPISYQSSTYQSPQYQTVSTASGYTQVDTRCLKSEQNRELIGGAVGGTVGAIAGKKFIGGTKGTVIGAVAGGAAGYGIGDKSINCDPIMVPASQTTTAQPPNYAPVQTQTYQTQPSSNQSYQTPAQYNPQYVAAPQQGQQTYTAPTDQAYGATVGTPGYDAIMGAQSQQVIPTQPQPVYTQAQPQQPVYLNPQPIYVQPQSVYLPGAPVTGSVTNTSVPVPQGQNGIPGISRHQVSEGDTVYSMARHLCVGVDDISQPQTASTQITIFSSASIFSCQHRSADKIIGQIWAFRAASAALFFASFKRNASFAENFPRGHIAVYRRLLKPCEAKFSVLGKRLHRQYKPYPI